MRRKTLIGSTVAIVAVLAAGALGVAGGIYYERSQALTGDGQLKPARLLPLLRNKEPRVRRAAVDILRTLGKRDPVCLAALQEVAIGDEDSMVRHNAFEAVSNAGGRNATAFLLDSLKSPDSGVRQQAARQLGKLKAREAFTPLVKLFERELQKARRQPAARNEVRVLAVALSKVNPGASLPYVLRAMQALPGDYMLRRTVADAATGEEAPALAEFAMKLPDHNAGAHQGVIKAFRKLRHRSAVPYLVKQLKNPNANVRREAAQALSYTAGRERFDDLAAAARKELERADQLPEGRSPSGASYWIDALRNTGDPRACGVFLEAAEKCKHRSVRVLAARQMRVCVDPGLGERIYKLYKTTKEEHLRRMLKLVLSQARGYGYRWDAEAKDFKREKGATPAPGKTGAPPAPKKAPKEAPKKAAEKPASF